jgi:hypothetical protein
MNTMSADRLPEISPRILRALDELKGIILGRYPDATFSVGPSPEDPDVVHLYATVDLEDTEELVDLVYASPTARPWVGSSSVYSRAGTATRPATSRPRATTSSIARSREGSKPSGWLSPVWPRRSRGAPPRPYRGDRG